ncbi:MAG: hypothetical protein KAT88_02035, partial [Spirochaetes bacterium]|nr:hypothetical protein [Spirochaetota bacterium]
MRKKVFISISVFSLIMALFFFFAGECGFEPETPASPASGDIVIIFSTPGIDKNTDGYLSGSGTLVVEEGDLKSYDLAIKETGVEVSWGKRWSFQVTGLMSVKSIFAHITSIDQDEQEFPLDGIDDDIPPFDEWSTKSTTTVTWNDNGTVKEVEIVSGGPIVWKAAYEYYENGKLKSERFYSLDQGEVVEFQRAYFYSEYGDPDFPNFQTEVWYYDTQGDGVIPDDYDYKANEYFWFHD